MALARIEMRGVVGFAKEINRDKANRGIGDVEGVCEGESSRRRFQFNGTYTQRVNRVVTKPFYRVGFDRAKRMKVRRKRRYVACGPSINNERERGGRDVIGRGNGKGRRRRKRNEGMVSIVINVWGGRNFSNMSGLGRIGIMPSGIGHVRKTVNKDSTRGRSMNGSRRRRRNRRGRGRF